MELTLKRYGISVKVLRQQVEEKTDRIVKQVYWHRSSEPHLDHQKQYLEASGSRYVSPIRECGRERIGSHNPRGLLMVQNVSSKEREQGAYASHMDGLLDLLVGLAVALGGLSMLLYWDVPFAAVWLVVWLPVWMSARKSIAARRMADVEASKEQYASMMRAGAFVVGILIVAVFAGMAVLWGRSSGSVPAWFLAGLREYLMVVLGLFGVLVIAVAGWLSGLNRLYAYAALTAVVFAGGYLLNAPIALAVTVVGSIITLWGAVMLIRFVRTHPQQPA